VRVEKQAPNPAGLEGGLAPKLAPDATGPDGISENEPLCRYAGNGRNRTEQHMEVHAGTVPGAFQDRTLNRSAPSYPRLHS
jgi:hypothetical protein